MGALLLRSRLTPIERVRLARAADIAAVLGVVGTVLATQLPPPDDMVVIAHVIVRPFRVAAACFTIAVVAWAVRRRLLRDVPRERPGRKSRVLRRLLTIGLAFASLVALAVTGFVGFLSSTGYAVGPPSPGGCRVYVAEWEGMLGSWGSVRVLRPGQTRPAEVSWFQHNGGLAPMRHGRYSLTWRGEVGTFRVWGEEHETVWPEEHTIRCDN